MCKIFKSHKRLKKYNANRFAACLLAVLMLFSALSTGSITVHADASGGSVAQIGNDYYTSLADAITAANIAATTAAVEIDLLAKVEYVETLTINKNVTLDLNGFTLEATGGISVITGGNVVDNSTGHTGFLEVDSEACVFASTNSQIPVYNGSTGYAFATITHQQDTPDVEDDAFELIFRPYFGTSDINALLAENGDATQVSIGIRLEWIDSDGKSQSKDLKYTDEMVKKVYAEGKAFYIKATGIDKFEDVRITPLVKFGVFTSTSTSIECLGEVEYATDYKNDAQYTRILYSEDFKGDTAMDTSALQVYDGTKGVSASIASDVNGNEYIKITHGNGNGNAGNHRFNMKYGSGSAIQNSGYKVGDTTRFKVSFDVCPTTTEKVYVIKLRDKYASTSTIGDEIIALSNGNVTFTGIKLTEPCTYTANQWLHFDVFYEFTGETTTSKYAIYMDNSFIGEVIGTKQLLRLVESIGIGWQDMADDTKEYTVYMDNLSIATTRKSE